MTEHARCPTCRYALINGVCPICDGRRVSDRLPMVAPLPAKPDKAVIPFRKRTRRSA